MTKPLVINLFAGPAAGKSTMSAGLFYRLKSEGYNAELAGEFAKDLSWSKRYNTLKDQLYVFGKQHYRIHRLKEDCDIVVADSPILLNLAYAEGYPQCFHDTVAWAFNQYNNLNFFLVRDDRYFNPKGRHHSLEESIDKDMEIISLLVQHNIDFMQVASNAEGLEKIMTEVKKVLDTFR